MGIIEFFQRVKYNLYDIVYNQIKEKSVDFEYLETIITNNTDKIELMSLNTNKDTVEGNPIEHMILSHINTVGILEAMKTELCNTEPVTEVKPRSAYAILPNGDIFQCNIYNHVGFYAAWAIKNNIPDMVYMLTNGPESLLEIAHELYGFVEFVTDGQQNFNTVYGDLRKPTFTKQQKEAILQMYEVNGIVNRYFEEVDQL